CFLHVSAIFHNTQSLSVLSVFAQITEKTTPPQSTTMNGCSNKPLILSLIYSRCSFSCGIVAHCNFCKRVLMYNFHNDPILYLCRDDVEQACKEIDSVAIVREVFRMHGTGQTILPDEAYMPWQNGKGEAVRSLNMPGYIGGTFNAAGTK